MPKKIFSVYKRSLWCTFHVRISNKARQQAPLKAKRFRLSCFGSAILFGMLPQRPSTELKSTRKCEGKWKSKRRRAKLPVNYLGKLADKFVHLPLEPP